jgi:hypothetical protein
MLPGLPVFVIVAFCAMTAFAGEAAVKKPSPGNTTYYLDAAKGDDANAGTSPAKAWKTLDRANQTAFAAGDKLLLEGGQKFAGTLAIGKEAQGTKEKPIVVSSTGQGPATIDGGKGSGIRLDGCAFVHVRGLNLIGCGRKDGNDGNGLEVNVTKSVEVDRVEVSGFRLSGISTGGDVDTRITNVNAHDNGFAGISTCGGYGKPRTTNLYIGHCVAHDNPGDPKNLKNHSGNGIVVGQLDGGLVEYCEAYNNGWDMPRKGNGPVGIWGWEAHRLTIQFCISHDNKTQKGAVDGGGFDFDGGMVDSILQYNLSYNNHGAGYLLCQYPGASVWKNNICRYNITINDAQTNHEAGIHFWEGEKNFSDAFVYNNLIVNSRHAVKSTGDVAGLVFRNNIFFSDSDSIDGPLKKARFEGNLYGSPKGAGVFRDGKTAFKTLEEWAKATGQETVGGNVVGVVADPRVNLPSKLEELPKDPAELGKMLFGRLLAGSPCAGAAVPVPDNGGRDLWGNPVPKDGPKNIGPCDGAPIAK